MNNPQGGRPKRGLIGAVHECRRMVNELMTPSGLLLRRDAVRAGLDDNALARLVRAGVITRIRQGAYAASDVWRASDAVGRHRLLAEAVLMQYDDDVAVSHDTAVVVLEGPNYGLDLTKVHLTHLTSTSGRRNVAGIVH